MPRPRASLDTAALARAFAADGLHGTSIERVAAAAGLAKPTLYARGGDKEELFAPSQPASSATTTTAIESVPTRLGP